MINKNINKNSKKKNVLVIPLDWGLGHATRCIPLIKEFLASGCNVIIAAENAPLSLLQHEFQQLTFIPVRGYRIRYNKKNNWLPLTIILQIPRILLTIYYEQQWIKKVVKKYLIDAIISDNRFGLYHAGVPSVYITHQLLIKTGSRFSEQIAQKIHYWFIRKYTYCWVPDYEGKKNIAGELSHPLQLPVNINYIGCLSRFEKRNEIERKYDLLIIISGPEPQRTIFETMLLAQLKLYKGMVLLVRGLPGETYKSNQPVFKSAGNPCLAIKNHLSAPDLNDAIGQAALVISRSGYTTIMDLIKLKKKAILVPTPGQTEQEYLATHLMKEKIFYAAPQEGFSLARAIAAAADFPFTIPLIDMEQYKDTVRQLVQSL